MNFPNLPVCKAILMSCSIPLIFQPISWEDDLYVDGALIDNFPLFTIPHNEIIYTLGVETSIKHCTDISCSDIYDYLINIYKIITQTNKIYKNFNIITISIDPNIISSSIDINLSVDNKIQLINEGYNQASKIYPTLFQNIINDKLIQTETILYRNRSKSI
jgi:predicted patatin/cPLA2 family phospholipase